MNQFSTTQVPDGPVRTCPNNCQDAMNMVMEDVNAATRIGPAIERNVAITEAYQQLGREMPDNHWVRLAGYVSVQGGCAMRQVRQGIVGASVFPPAGPFVGEGLVQAMDALRDANTTIFTSVYPPNRFMHECGFEKLKQCVESGELEVDPDLMTSLEKLNNGDLAGAADGIAEHEQVDVVQPVYERHTEAFDFLESVDGWIPGDQTSIPVAYECTRDNLVPLGNLDITNPHDRVQYYGRLMDRMREIEGL